MTGVTTIAASRTLWDKVIILHGLRRWFDKREESRQEGHYYDVHQLCISLEGTAALSNRALGEECARHASMFFNRPDFDLATATPGSFALSPAPAMRDRLQRDYDSTAGMIFGAVPTFETIMESIFDVESRLNAAQV